MPKETLVIDGLTFVKQYGDLEGSKYHEYSRGAATPTELLIRHSAVTDSRTKRPAQQSAITVNRYEALTDGTIAVVSTVTMTSRSLLDKVLTAGMITGGIETLVALVTDTAANAAALNMMDDIFVNKVQ